MVIAILNYEIGTVDLWDDLPDLADGEVEDYLSSVLGYNLSAISYMCDDKEIPCYLNNNEEPFNILRR